MHKKVKKIVDRIWTDRIKILFDPDTTKDHSDTIEDRCYTYYANSTPIGTQAIDKSTLNLTGLDNIAASWGFDYSCEQKGTFRRYELAKWVGHANSRIYINAKPAHAEEICRDHLFPLFGIHKSVYCRKRGGGKPTFVDNRKAELGEKVAPNFVGNRKAELGEKVGGGITTYAGKVRHLKVAEGTEAFSSRREKIVLYTTANLNEAVTIAKQLNIPDGYLEKKVPPMTLKVAPGVAVGVDLHGKQIEAGTSFGDARCSLIAKALLQVCTGMSVDEFITRYRETYSWGEVDEEGGKNYEKAGAEQSDGAKWKVHYCSGIYKIKAPISKHQKILRNPEPTPNEFENQVSELFRGSDVDPNVPWE